MAERGYASADIIMFRCDQGNDVSVDLALSDGQIVKCDFKEDPATRTYVSISRWKPWVAGAADLPSFELEVLTTPKLKQSFDRAVLAYFDFHLREFDRPLPIV